MKYALFLYDDEAEWTSLSEAERGAVIGEHMAYVDALVAAGAMQGGEPLQTSEQARTLRGGKVEDGPYADTREQLGGFYVIDVADMDVALDWARKCPTAKTGVVEVRPVPDYGG
ncbi:MAG: YciI family protein [Pseudomonadota bacterium]